MNAFFTIPVHAVYPSATYGWYKRGEESPDDRVERGWQCLLQPDDENLLMNKDAGDAEMTRSRSGRRKKIDTH